MNQQPSDDRCLAALMKAAQDGDASAYHQLLRDVTLLLRKTVRHRRRFLQPQDIEDLVQDTLLSLHAVRATYDSKRPFLPWLMAIARNRIADGARRYARRAAHELQVDELPVTLSDEGANIPVDSFGDPEALKQAIQTLPPAQREAIEMLKLREMSLKEAAIASGMTIGALKVAVHRGVKALRKVMIAEA